MTKLWLPPHVAREAMQRRGAIEQRKRELQENNPMHDTAEYQRRKMMTQDEKNYDAIERMARERAVNKGITFEQARREILVIVHRSHRDKGIE